MPAETENKKKAKIKKIKSESFRLCQSRQKYGDWPAWARMRQKYFGSGAPARAEQALIHPQGQAHPNLNYFWVLAFQNSDTCCSLQTPRIVFSLGWSIDFLTAWKTFPKKKRKGPPIDFFFISKHLYLKAEGSKTQRIRKNIFKT